MVKKIYAYTRGGASCPEQTYEKKKKVSDGVSAGREETLNPQEGRKDRSGFVFRTMGKKTRWWKNLP